MKNTDRNIRIVVIGAGPGGLCTGIKLQEAGYEDFVILEKGDGVGGTWFHNTYPGCECDLQSALYSFSFEQKVDWSKPYGTQPEILAYMQGIAEKYGLLPHCRFGNGVWKVVWSDEDARWTVTLESGDTLEAEIVVSAIGMFNELIEPDFEGLQSFEGHRFHSARWDWDHDLSGRTVGVIGSAASAVQFVPEIVKQAGQVYLYQRTANWVLPKDDVPYTEEQLVAFREDPSLFAALRQEFYDTVDDGMDFHDKENLALSSAAGREALEAVRDPEVREKLRPQHSFGCKRPLLSNYFYEAFNRPNLELVTESIERITKDGIVTSDGQERKIDTLILATGFGATKYLSALDVTGRGGQHIDDAWDDGASAYLGMTTTGFPNLFMLYGPNMNNGSILEMLEAQVAHIVKQVERIDREDLAWIDVKPEPQAAWNEEVQQAISKVDVWVENCNGYYRSPSGRIVTQWPFSMRDLWKRSKDLHEDAFEVEKRSA